MTSTAKNFAGQNLRGRSFKWQELSGADFSGADLRGANFTDATLIGANFSKARTGVQKRWLVCQLVISFFSSALSGFLAAFTGVWVALFFSPSNIKSFTIAPGMAMIIIVIVCSFAIIRQGFTASAFGAMAGILSLALVVLTLAGAGELALAVVLAGALAALAVVVLSWALALSGAVAVVALAGSLAGAVEGKGSGLLALVRSGSLAGLLAESLALAGAVGTVLLSVYVSWRTLKGDPKFDTMLKFSVAFASECGTSFRGADLKSANFTDAYLKSSDFRNSRRKNTNLTRTLWRQAEKLNRSRLGTSILANPEVRELLVTGKPNQTQSYEGLNLRGANLDGAYLKEVNFKRAILNEASFRKANLESVNFTEAQVIGTDFTGAQMTGVCLEGWSYDHTTKLDGVDSL